MRLEGEVHAAHNYLDQERSITADMVARVNALMTDDFTTLRADLVRNTARQIDLVEQRLAAVRAALQRTGDGACVTPNTEVLASEVLQLLVHASRLDQLPDITKEDRAAVGPLVGVGDIATMFGVSRQRITALRQSNPRFPVPLGEPSSGPVWRKADIETFYAGWNRRTGRPRKTKENRA